MALWRIKLTKPHVMFRIVKSGNYKTEIKTNYKQLPFNMMAVSMDPFNVLSAGVNYSYAGITIHFQRNDIGRKNTYAFSLACFEFKILSLIYRSKI